MRMYRAAYRLDWPVTVVVEQTHHHRLMQLPAGAVFYAVAGTPDRNRMIRGICNGDVVLMFARDLENCAQRVAGGR